MTAQVGNAVVLAYGAQGTQQTGNALVLNYSAATGQRRLSASTVSPWHASAILRKPLRAVVGKSIEPIIGRRALWLGAASLRKAERVKWLIATKTDVHAAARFPAAGKRLVLVDRLPWGVATRRDEHAAAPWGRFERLMQIGESAPWPMSTAVNQFTRAPWRDPMQIVQPGLDVIYARGAPVDHMQDVVWNRYTTQAMPSWSVVIPVHDSTTGLEALFVVPVQRFYMQVNTTALRRVDTNTQLPTFSLSLTLDAGSWVWAFNASLPADQLSLVEPVAGAPVELEAMVNGTAFRLLVDSIARAREFGKETIALTGRGKAALLAAPFSPIYQFDNASGDRTAQQLINEALGKSAFGATWSVNWGAVDWLVPAGVWSYSGSQMDAINAIAAAAGLYVQPDAAALSLSVLPQYPFAPWDWIADVAPDYELPVDVVTRESIDWSDKPAYNRVFVSGTQGGVLGQVTRNGTAGDVLAPMVTDALITHADAARQRGNMILSDTGRIANVSLRLPVLATTGVILPGKFVRYLDGSVTRFGIVRSTSLEVALPTVWQTIGVETHVS